MCAPYADPSQWISRHQHISQALNEAAFVGFNIVALPLNFLYVPSFRLCQHPSEAIYLWTISQWLLSFLSDQTSDAWCSQAGRYHMADSKLKLWCAMLPTRSQSLAPETWDQTWFENVSLRGRALLTDTEQKPLWQVSSGTYEKASSWRGIGELLWIQSEALISQRAIKTTSLGHNETLYSEAAVKARFQSDQTLASELENTDMAAVERSCVVTLHEHFFLLLRSLVQSSGFGSQHQKEIAENTPACAQRTLGISF